MGKNGKIYNDLEKNNKYIDEKTAQIVIFPRLGAFEIEVEGILISSKLTSSVWPNFDQIA